MRAVVALGVARQVVVSSASVSSTLAGFQKFTDEMVAKYVQEPVQDLDAASQESARGIAGTKLAKTSANGEELVVAQDGVGTGEEASGTQAGVAGQDDSQDTVTSVAGAGGTDHSLGVTDDDKQQILDVIEWLEGLDQELLAQHVEDDELQKECQVRVDLCESVERDDTKIPAWESAQQQHSDVTGKVHYYEIGSHLTQGVGSGSAHLIGVSGKSVLSPKTQTTAPDRTKESNLAVQDGASATVRPLSSSNVPTYKTTSSTDESDTITAFAKNVEPAHYSKGEQQTDGIGVISGQFGAGSEDWAGKGPWTNVINREECSYMTSLTEKTGDTLSMKTGLSLDAFYSPTEVDDITQATDLVVQSGEFKGTQEFLADETNPGYDKCGSRWTQMTEFEMRHKSCRENHQQVACADQRTHCDAYDKCRKSTKQTDGGPKQDDPNCYEFPTCALGGGDGQAAGAGDLRDEYISTEWWFKERKTMENCLEKTTQWFTPLWDKYQLCDQAIKYCAEATLTCDNIQWEFEARHCEWDKARKESCDAHYECYEKEVRRCAQTCDIVKLRETGRKAEDEIIQRIICMLKALLANNDEHFDSGSGPRTSNGELSDTAYNNGNAVEDGGTGSFRIEADRQSDYGSKQSRLDQCRRLTPDTSRYNLVCQGPKVKNSDGKYEVGDQFSHYRHWSLEKGGEFPRLQDQVNGACSKPGGSCTSFEGQIEVNGDDWMGETCQTNSKQACVTPYSGTPGSYAFDAEAKTARHRESSTYTPWGFDCDFSNRPCTHQFILDHYEFLQKAGTTDMERAPCHASVCGETVFPESYAHGDSKLCSECEQHNLEHRTGDCACLTGGTMQEDICASDSTTCQCLSSRDENFCNDCESTSTCGNCDTFCEEAK